MATRSRFKLRLARKMLTPQPGSLDVPSPLAQQPTLNLILNLHYLTLHLAKDPG